MPLGFRGEGITYTARFCGVETPFYFNIKETIKTYIVHGDFDFVVSPLMFSGHSPSKDRDPEVHNLDRRLYPYAETDINVAWAQWAKAGIVVAKICPWLDLDSEDENVRTDSEAILKQQIEWASYLSLKACLLPTPKGNSCANYARCVNQILKGPKNNMQLLLRIPIGMSDNDYSPRSNASVDSWQTWNSFRVLCDHHNLLTIALDIKRVLPPENSLKRWYGEPVDAAILDTDIFLTKARGNTTYLPKRHQKLIADLLDHNKPIIISGIKVPIDAQSAAGSKRHPLRPYLDQVSNVYKQRNPLSERECREPFRNFSSALSYEGQATDSLKYTEYERAICKALLDRVPNEKASFIVTVLVVVGAGRGSLVFASLKAAEITGRKLKVYAVEKNPQTVIALDEVIKANNWVDIVFIVTSDVRYWNAPERADILVSDLLGSFGDNELSPESLDGAQRFLEKDGISIPSSYTSFLQPLTASKSYQIAKARKYILHSESACVVKLYNVARLAPSQQVFTFTHPKWFDKESNERYKKLQFEIPKDTGSAMVHGFAGYFNMTLYKDVCLATEPSTKKPDLFSWFPMFFPLRMPIRVDRGSILEVHFWRCVDSRKVGFLFLFLHFMLLIWIALCNLKQVWYEWCVTSPSSSPIHNCNGRSCWMDL
ncbi:protein arginine N-methyltransferase 1.5-like isoform X3 [Cicer arietinum]|uniref:Protein arginine N-methyltransferase n=1 Tax=Cicer arietinum TaxID=3827 RepID=A0A3Q7XQ62_CICAR|nr:protein arginine N-methyltransferase 1.5-like isoform X3 [Cicer arietinum]